MPPGMTYLPAASTTSSTVVSRSTPRAVDPGCSRAATVSPSTRTSAAPEPVLLITVPFLINVVLIVVVLRSWLGDRGVRVRSPITIELPGVAYLSDHAQIKITYYDVFVLIAAHSTHHIALRIAELARAVERDGQLAVLVVLATDSVRRGDEVAIGSGGRRLLDFPEPIGKARLGGVGVEDDLRPVQAELAPPFWEVPVVADIDADAPDGGLEHRVAQIARPEIELLPELIEVWDVVLAVRPNGRPVGIDHDRGVVVNA